MDQSIASFFENYLKAYSEKDVAGIMNMVGDDPILFIGTGADEWVETRDVLQAAYERDFSQVDSVLLECPLDWVQELGDTACVAGPAKVTVSVNNASAVYGGRLSLVLHRSSKTGGEWKIIHSHCSYANPHQDEGESFAGENPA